LKLDDLYLELDVLHDAIEDLRQRVADLQREAAGLRKLIPRVGALSEIVNSMNLRFRVDEYGALTCRGIVLCDTAGRVTAELRGGTSGRTDGGFALYGPTGAPLLILGGDTEGGNLALFSSTGKIRAGLTASDTCGGHLFEEPDRENWQGDGDVPASDD